MEIRPGTFYGVGVGPGDPELITRKAARILEQCPVLAAPCTKNGEMRALEIAKAAVSLAGKEVLPLPFTMARDPAHRKSAHPEAVRQIEARLAKGLDVAMVNLGDVALYATYSYLAEEIRAKGYETAMIPGITSFSAAAARLGVSLTAGDIPLHILPMSGTDAMDAVKLPGTKVLMKSGSCLPAIKQALDRQGLLAQAALVANCGMENEWVCTDLRQAPEQLGYYTTILIKE